MRNLKADDQLLRHALATNFQRVICGGAVSCLTSDKGQSRRFGDVTFMSAYPLDYRHDGAHREL